MRGEPEPDSPFGDLEEPVQADPVGAYRERLRQQRQFRGRLYLLYALSLLIVLLTSAGSVVAITQSVAELPAVLGMGALGAVIGLAVGWAFGVLVLGRLAVQADTAIWTTPMPTSIARDAAKSPLWAVSAFTGLLGIATGAVVGEMQGLRGAEALDTPYLAVALIAGPLLGLVICAAVGFVLLRPRQQADAGDSADEPLEPEDS